jgi:Peroxisomal biogenesis factor 11 (PEX11)
MKDVKFLLQTWTKIALNVRLRDRSVKIIQYGCQMLIGYYGHRMSDEIVSGLRNTRRICSTARKAFWLLKSINHIGTMNVMLEKSLIERPLAEKFDFLEQIFLVFYYLFENQIFLSRCQLFDFREEELDLWCNVSWFAGDVALFFSVGLKLNEIIRRRKNMIEKLKNEDSIENQTEFREIEQRYSDLQLSFAIAVLELGVSMHYIYIWRKLRGEAGCIRDGNVGLMGVASSVLIIYEGYRNVVRSS